MLSIDKSSPRPLEAETSFDLFTQNMPRPKPPAPQLPREGKLSNILPARWSDAERTADYSVYRRGGNRISLGEFDAMFSSGAPSGKKEDGTQDIFGDEQGVFANNSGKDIFDLPSSKTDLDLSQNKPSEGLPLIDRPPEFKREDSKELENLSIAPTASDNIAISDRFEASFDGEENPDHISANSALQHKGQEDTDLNGIAAQLSRIPSLKNITKIQSIKQEDGESIGPFSVRFIGGTLFELTDTHQKVDARVNAQSGELEFMSIKEE